MHLKNTVYTRTGRNELDFLVSICSLCLTTLGVLKTIFNYYSQNFDNYKIIEKIFKSNNNDIKKNEFNNNSDNCINDLNLNINPIIPPDNQNKNEKNVELTKLDNSTPLIDNNDNGQIMSINNDNNNNIIQDVGVDEKGTFILPKGKFYEFYINNISFFDCCKNDRQKIINVCNDIISKYFSIDYIIYNHIKLENMLKDYKWNNPSLNNVENNDLFIKLKKLL